MLIKAAAGGGGKGMRVVEEPGGFEAALTAARREAEAGFGDPRMLIEKYLERPRHVELQVFADDHGGVVHLFERDCSIQRRHQKVLEEAPAPGLEPAMRAAMGEAAVAAAAAIGYRGAGTVEFITAGDAFFFIEMNTRLQVEHPVTELVTGQDLVEWQLRIAAGEPLPCRQEELAVTGHAIEARLYAEDPARDFLPAAGRLGHLRFPAEGRHLRIDSGVRAGDRVATHYDPMLAKLIVWDRDRPAALERLAGALAETEVLGVTTNLAFLAAVAGDEDYRAGRLDTGFIARRGLVEAAAGAALPAASDEALAFASLAEILRRGAEAAGQAARSGDPHSPWHMTNGWRLNSGTFSRLLFHDGARERAVALHYEPAGYGIEIDGRTLIAREVGAEGIGPARAIVAEIDGRRRGAVALREGTRLSLLLDGVTYVLGLHDPLALGAAEDAAAGGRLTAPMPGKVLEVLVGAGVAVARGDPLIVLEAMKMEHTVAAPLDGVVAVVHFAAGDLVEEGAELIGFQAEAAGDGAA